MKSSPATIAGVKIDEVNTGAAATYKLLLTAVLVVAESRVKLMVLVVLVYVPGDALAGTNTETVKLQLLPEVRLAPAMVKLELPVMVEPEPQNPVVGNEVAAKPESVAFKSLVKVMSVASFRSALVML